MTLPSPVADTADRAKAATAGLQSLYSSASKLLIFGTEHGVAVIADAAPSIELWRVEATDGGLAAIGPDGRRHRFDAPAAGSVALGVGEGGAAAATAAEALWTVTGLPAPRRLPLEAGAAALIGAVTEALGRDAAAIAADAVRLDRQIAALREALEDARGDLWSLRVEGRLGGHLPVLAVERRPETTALPLDGCATLRQRAPLSPHLIRGIGLCLDGRAVLAGAGPEAGLSVRLEAAEDGATLAHWHVPATEIASTAQAWVTLSVPEISRRYRFVDIVMSWRGDADAPPVWTAPVTGDPDHALRDDHGAPLGAGLALRVWTGAPFTQPPSESWVLDPATRAAYEDETRRLRLTPRVALAAATPLGDHPEANWKWFRVEGGDVFLHPKASEPSMVAAPLQRAADVTGLTARLELTHERAPATQFAIVVTAAEVSFEAALALADPEGPDAAPGLVGRLPWTAVDAGTVAPVSLRLAPSEKRVMVHLMTRVTGASHGFAHAWFRDLAALT